MNRSLASWCIGVAAWAALACGGDSEKGSGAGVDDSVNPASGQAGQSAVSVGGSTSAPSLAMADLGSTLPEGATTSSLSCEVDAECSATSGCCEGLVCVTLTQGDVTTQTCQPSCGSGDECDTGCCADVGTARACLPVAGCPDEFCSELGGPCGDADSFCCEGGACTNVNGSGFTCRAICTSDADCPGGCCRAAGESSACFDQQFCQ